jgi:hypothetical protein
MAHNPKLEVYQVWINSINGENKTFRDFTKEVISISSESQNNQQDELSNSYYFLDLFKTFIHKVDNDSFILNQRKQKAFTAYDTRPAGEEEPSITPHSDAFIIEGTIDGGRYGQRRTKSSLDNKLEKEDVVRENIILDKFYFFLYTPMNSDLGILFIQSYSTDSISDIFTDFISRFFSAQKLYRKARIEKFVPKRIVEEFKNHSCIKKFSFSNRFVFNQLSENPIGTETEEFIIKIEAVAKNGLPKNALKNWINTMGEKIFSNKKLENFNNGKVYLQDLNSKKESPFDISSDLDIKPIIYLEDRITVDDDGIPNFIELKNYCTLLLNNEIIPEMYPSNEVREC